MIFLKMIFCFLLIGFILGVFYYFLAPVIAKLYDKIMFFIAKKKMQSFMKKMSREDKKNDV